LLRAASRHTHEKIGTARAIQNVCEPHRHSCTRSGPNSLRLSDLKHTTLRASRVVTDKLLQRAVSAGEVERTFSVRQMANVEYGAMPRLMPMPGTWGAVMREANATVRQRQREQVPMADADKLRLRAERMAHGGQHTPMLMVDGHLSDGTVLPSDSSAAVRRSPVRGGGGLLRGAAGIPTSVAAHHLSSLGTTASPGTNHQHHLTHQGSPAAGSPSRRRGGHAEAAKAAGSPRPRYDGGSTSTTELISRHPRDVQFRSPKNALLDGAATSAARNPVAPSGAADGLRWLPRGSFSTPSAPPVAPFHARIAERLGAHGAFVPREVPAVGHGPRR
jgi:hypothetical protein